MHRQSLHEEKRVMVVLDKVPPSSTLVHSPAKRAMLMRSPAKLWLCVYDDMSRRDDITVTSVSTSSLEGDAVISESTRPVPQLTCLTNKDNRRSA